jgi:hypothetical protein|nr:MAG TPA: hypothetical protein [Caudoviricetes sp.]
MRGIVAGIEYGGSANNLQIYGGLDPEKLRQYILYGDKIDYPNNNIIGYELTPDEEFLLKCGVLERTMCNFSGTVSIGADLLLDIQLAVFNEHLKQENEIWSIAQPTREIILPENQSILKENLQVELYNCLPVPTIDTPFETILDFKRRRNSELLAFRALLDNMYEDIISHPDADFAKRKSIENIENALIDIDRTLEESKIKRLLKNMKAQINMGKLAELGIELAGGTVVGQKMGLDKFSGIVGAVASIINITQTLAQTPKCLSPKETDYAYLFYAKEEL